MDNVVRLPQHAHDHAASGAAQHPENPLLLVHRCIRGRYPLAIALAVLLAIPCAIAGYFAVPPKYTSTGIVKIHPFQQMILYEIEANQPLPMFESFVSAQAALIQTRRVMDEALRNKDLLASGWPTGESGIARLIDSLKVEQQMRGELIFVRVESESPVRAQKATNAMLEAYDELFREQNGLTSGRVEESVRQLVSQRERELANTRDRIRRLGQDYGSPDLAPIIQQKLDQINELDRKVPLLEDQIAQLESRASMTEEKRSTASDALIEQLARNDPTLAALMARSRELQMELDRTLAKVSPQHRSVLDIKATQAAVESQVRLRVEELTRNLAAEGADDASIMAGVVGLNLEQSRIQLARYKELREQLSKEIQLMTKIHNDIQVLRDEEASRKRELEEAQRRLVEIQVEKEGTSGGRISIAQRGDLPVEPSTDRRIPLSIVGGVFGVVLGFGSVGFAGFVRRAYRFIDDIDQFSMAPLLGTLPELRSADAEQDELTVLSVHHIRNMLLLRSQTDQRKSNVITITSSNAGDGKTSLTAALGMSFAAGGRRTVLVDLDLVGRGLSRQLRLNDRPGLIQSVTNAEVNGFAHPTDVPNLWAIPAGISDGFEPEHLSGEGVAKLISELRRDYDTVLIDTGPVLGSLEADLATSLADRVVLAVSRGQSQKLVTASLQRLRSLGANCAGLVFNRANPTDIQRSVSHASIRSQSTRALPSSKEEKPRGRSIAELVAKSAPTKRLPDAPGSDSPTDPQA